MALELWQTGAWQNLREGQALYDTAAVPGWFRTHHAMLVRSRNAGAAVAVEGLRVRVTHMGPPLYFKDEDPGVMWPLGEKTYLGYFPNSEFNEEQYLRVGDEMRKVESRAAACGTARYSLANFGTEEADPNNPGETLETPYCSCASLVEACYAKAGVTLVDKQNLPRYYLEEIQKQFCPYDSHGEPKYEERPLRRMLRERGLHAANEPWPLLLPAHQMLAFQNGFAALPHAAAKTDHPFCPLLSAPAEGDTPATLPPPSPTVEA